MKKILGLLRQYNIEISLVVLAIVFALVDCVRGEEQVIEALIIYFVLMSVLYIVWNKNKVRILGYISKMTGEILHLSIHDEICMLPKKFESENLFLDDMKKIIEYAKENNIEKMYAKTHKIMVLCLLADYSEYSRKEIYKTVEQLNVNEKIKVDTNFGYIEVEYMGKRINSCNRYNTSKKGFKKLLEEKDSYKLVMGMN